jgi:hypothetical protein
MSQKIWWVILVAALAAGALAVYFGFLRPEPAVGPAPGDIPAVAELREEEADGAVRHPLPDGALEAVAAPDLPPVNASDPFVRESLTGLLGDSAVRQFVAPDNLARRFVATLDNLPRRRTPVQLRPVLPTPGAFLVDGTEEGNDLVISPRNFERYQPLVQLLERTDTARAANAYFRLYPLLQRAYEDLGYPQAYLNDRLVAVIDHLLTTPEVAGPIELTQPRVFYEFADPQLEALSSGQKLILRMGPENGATVRRKLRELRAEVVARGN